MKYYAAASRIGAAVVLLADTAGSRKFAKNIFVELTFVFVDIRCDMMTSFFLVGNDRRKQHFQRVLVVGQMFSWISVVAFFGGRRWRGHSFKRMMLVEHFFNGRCCNM